MKHFIFCTLVISFFSLAATSHSATFSAVGDSEMVEYNAFMGNHQFDLGIGPTTGQLELTAIEDGGSTWIFSGTISNLSSINSRISVIGFDVSESVDVPESSASSGFSNVSSGRMAQNINVDYCLKNANGNNCVGGGGSLLMSGAPLQFQFSIELLNPTDSLELNNYWVRYQSVGNAISGQISPIPLPAAGWLMLSALVGLGSIGRRNSRH